jgi:sarcosine oxidase subunit beta
MPHTADVIVVGAGINGAATAFALTRAGIRDVLVLEAKFPCYGASGHGDGILRTHYANPHETALAIRSLEIYRSWLDVVGGTCGYFDNGFLWMVGSDDAETLRSNVEMQRALGARVDICTPDQLALLQPHLETADIGLAAYEPLSGGGDAATATRSLLAAAIQHGATLRTRTPVRRLVIRHGSVAGVETDDGEISASTVVLATGAWSARLAASVDINLPIESVRCTTGRVFLPKSISEPMNFIDVSMNLFVKVTQDRMAHIAVRDADHWSRVNPSEFDSRVEDRALRDGRDALAVRIPAMREASLESAWAGVDAVTPDRKAILGPVPGLRGLQLCLGSSFKGFKLAPAVGELIANQIVTGGAVSNRLGPFTLERFGQDARRWSESEYVTSMLA